MSVRSDIVALVRAGGRGAAQDPGAVVGRSGSARIGARISLCFAVIVARLEDDLGVDPFSADDDIGFPVTVGDFIALYEHAVADAAD